MEGGTGMNDTAITAAIVEDEEPSRKRLKRLLGAFSDTITVVGEADNGETAVDLIQRLRPRLLFLDIQLPGIDGLKVLERLSYQPAVIFTSAYHQYALDAFKAIAIDYLLKPIDAAKLEKAIRKLETVGFQQEDLTSKLEQLLNASRKAHQPRIPLKVGERIDLVDPDEILYFQSDNKYTKVKTSSREYIIDTPLVDIEKKLNPDTFIRIHRATIVNLDWVVELHKWFGGRLKVCLRDKDSTELVASRSYAGKLTAW